MHFNRALLLVPLLAACSTPEGEYPSLAIRDAERATGSFEPVEATPYVAPPTPAAVVDRLSRLASDAACAHKPCLADAPAARSATAGAGGAVLGRESWARASVALAGLESARSKAMIALADLDRLMVDAAVEGGELERIVAVRNTVTAQVDEQNTTIEALSRNLR
jgi:hypothetical protein